jgi:hypothetical protein
MANILYAVFYVSIAAAVLACIVYLVITRKPGPRPSALGTGWLGGGTLKRSHQVPSQECKALTEELNGEHRLSDLGWLLGRLGAAEAWGMLISLNFTLHGQKDWAEMIIREGGVDFGSNNGGAVDDYLGKFRRAASKEGLQVRAESDDSATIEVTGAWQDIGNRIARLVRDIYDLRSNEIVEVSMWFQ